ncbi:MAG: lipopolysaccharide kinase InaA family protein [Kiritimatiellia bacterium]
MKRSTNSKWITRRVAAPGGGTLKVTFRADDPKWPVLAPACWDMNLPGFEPVKCAPFSNVRKGRLEGETSEVYLKKFLVRGWRDAVKGLFRASRAWRAWRGDLLIGNAGFSAPRVRCLIRPCGIFRSGSMLITDEVRDAVAVKKRLLDPQYGLPVAGPQRHAFIRAVAKQVAALHGAGICHGDLRLGNILSRETAGGWEFIWLDNERNRRYRSLPRRLRNRNLMQFNMDRPVVLADRLCFWRAYVRASKLSKEDMALTARWIRARTRKRWLKHGFLK